MNETPGPPAPDATPPTPRLTITSEDLTAPTVDARVKELKDAATPQLVRQVGAAQPASTNKGVFQGAVMMMALAGLVGGLVGWFFAEVIMRPDSLDGPFADDPSMGTAVWMTIFSLGLATVLTAWEGVESRSPEKAWMSLRRTLPIVAGLALIGGFIAQALWEPMLDSAIDRVIDRAMQGNMTEAEAIRQVENAMRIPRAIAFLAAGAAVGVGLGLGSRAKQRVINGAMGGAAGGFVGGLAFSLFSAGGPARATTLTVTGVAVAAAIALVEQARKDLWLEIVTGGMAGKQFIIYHDRTMIGSSPHCGVTLIKDAGIAPEHAELVQSASGTTVRALGQQPVVVNGQQVREHRLTDGDQMQLGSTVVRFATKEQAMPTLTEAF